MPAPLSVGDAAPDFDLLDQHNEQRTLASFAGQRLMVFFYPKASTPGCTTQACLMRDLAPTIDNVAIVGVSPDTPKRQSNFDNKHELGFPLLSDPDHELAEAFGIWQEKKLYGKVYMGVVRSAFLIDEDGQIAAAFPKVSPKDTPVKLLAALTELEGENS